MRIHEEGKKNIWLDGIMGALVPMPFRFIRRDASYIREPGR